MAGRYQMWRHTDAAWEVRGRRKVFGFFIVEGEGGDVPDRWRKAAFNTRSDSAIASSLPHRSREEVAELSSCFLGVTTWGKVCGALGLDASSLPCRVDDEVDS